MLQRAKDWLYEEESAFVALCCQKDAMSFCAFRKREGWELFHQYTIEMDVDREPGEQPRILTEKMQLLFGRWGMMGTPVVLVLSEDGVDHSYHKAFPSLEKDALEVAVQWDATAALGLSSRDIVVGYRVADGMTYVAMTDRRTLEGYRQMFREAGIALRDIVFVEGLDSAAECFENAEELRYKSLSCAVATPVQEWTEGLRLAFLGAMEWQMGTAISLLSKASNPKAFRWNRMAVLLLALAAGGISIPLGLTYLQMQSVQTELREVDHRLSLLADDIGQRELDRQTEASIEKKNRALLRLSGQSAPYRGLLIRLGAVDAMGVDLEEVHFDAEGTSTIHGRAGNYERLSDYMRALTVTDAVPRVEANLQQAEQRQDAKGIDFVLTVQLPREGETDER